MNQLPSQRSPFILAIDIGSSSTRCEVFDSNLSSVADTFTQREYQLDTGGGGKAELDPVELFEVATECVGQSLRNAPSIEGVGISCFWHSILGVDHHFEPVTGVLMWADTRAASAADRLRGLTDPVAHHQATGTRLHTSYPMAKLRWLNDEHPDLVEKVDRWMSFPEYLQARLTGELTISTSMASGTGLFNRRALEWDSDALNFAGVAERQLSPLSDEPVPLTDEAGSPQLNGARWFPAIGDGAANNLGSYAVQANHPALMIGTTGALRLVTGSPPSTLPPRLWQYRLDRENALLGGALSEGGGVIAWLLANLETPGHDELERRIAASTPDGHGLTVLPYLAGERSPNWHSDAVGTIHGIRFDTRSTDIVQATMESIGYSFAGILEDLAPMLETPVEIIATGNALRQNPTWVQMIADIAGYPLLMPRTTESSLRGAALHALRQLGAEPEAPDIRENSDRYEPRADHAEAYAAARARQAGLYQLLVARDEAPPTEPAVIVQ
jgi:gluconokinase